jgi:ribosomal protein S12 methylthiotransferase accessory factor
MGARPRRLGVLATMSPPADQWAPAREGWSFRSVKKTGTTGHRTVPPRDTLERLQATAARIPITRVSDLSPLDPLRLPVYSATTPLARDLTTHLGKGLDHVSARLSAMMEALERVSAERVDRPTRHATLSRMADEVSCVIDPKLFDLPDNTRFHDELPISWIDGWDLVHKEAVWLPLDLAVTPPEEGVLQHVDTNGLASGNTMLEAVVHGVCEVIERDALGLLLFRSSFQDPEENMPSGRRIVDENLEFPGLDWLGRLAACGLEVHIELLDSDIGIPVFRSVLIDHAYPSRGSAVTRRFVGLGASPNAATAAIRSVTEAVQSRMALIQGARDSFNSLSAPWRPYQPALSLRDFDALERIPFGAVVSFSTDDLLEDLHYLLERLTAAGFDRVLVVNLSRAEFGFPVVRVRVPGLTSFAVNRARAGWRCIRYLL